MKRYGIMVLALFILVSGCTEQRTVQKAETIMGTQVSLTVSADSAGASEAAIEAGMAEIRRLDSMMSLYKDDSEITRVNLSAGKTPVKVSSEMLEMVEFAVEASKLTNGAFDVTIGPLVVLWQMRLKEGKVPTDEEIKRILPLVGYRQIVLDKKASTIFLRKPGMIMDFGGCAKGYAADRIRALFRDRGIDNAIISLAGDIWVMGRREDGKPWRIGVQHPREKDKTLTVLELRDKYISTSGDYERFVIREKKRYHHIIDPRTGKPSPGVISVTLVGDKGALIDPLTTALFILGPDEGMRLVKKIGAEVIFVDDDGTVSKTEGIKLP